MNPSFVPTVTINETIATTAAAATLPLYACVIGPQAQLVRYTAPAEQAGGLLGAYNPILTTTYQWPALAAGAAVDLAYPGLALWCKQAKLAFFSYPIGSAQAVTGSQANPNQVAIAGTAGFTTAGGAPLVAGLYGRGVRLGDRVRVSATVAGTPYQLDSYVTGFVGDPVAAVISAAATDAGNHASQALATTVNQTAGATNCMSVAASAASYNGLPTGAISETYTVSVIQGSTGNDPTTALLSIASASGGDNVASVAPAAAGTFFTVGSRGLQLKVVVTSGPCNLVAGQAWSVQVTQAFTRTAAVSGGTYSGAANDTYVVTVSRGGNLADATPPQWTVSTARGLDSGGPTSVTQANVALPIGTQGVTLKLAGTTATATATVAAGVVTGLTIVSGGSGYSSVAPPTVAFAGPGTGASATAVVVNGVVTGFTGLVGGTGYTTAPTVTIAAPAAVTALCAGDRFYVPVTAATTGRQGTLALADVLPAALQTASDLNLWVYVEQDAAIAQDRLGSNPLLNWTATASGLTANAGITLQVAGFVDSGGSPIALSLIDGTLYASYRAWMPASAALGGVSDVSQVPAALGTIDADNPAAFGVAMALANSAGVAVKYVTTGDPTVLGNWSAALATIAGRTDVYKLAPLSTDKSVLALVQAHVDDQSGAEAGCNRSAFFGIAPTIARPLVSQATSSDGNQVMATLAASAGTNYNLLTVTSGNAALITAGVKVGDSIRYLFTTAFGQQSYSTFTVAQVVSQTSLLLATSASSPSSTPQLVEAWHTLSYDEQVSDLIAQAAAFSDTRVCAAFSDLLAGYAGKPTLRYEYLACALAGLRSGSPPHQSLTGVPVSGLAAYAAAAGYLNGTQVGTLCANGVWIVTSTPSVASGAPITRLATTTLPGNPANIATREEMVRSNADNMELFFRQDLAPYLTRANMVSSALAAIRTQVVAAHTYLKQSGRTDLLGGQLVDFVVKGIYQHAVLIDTLVIDATWTLPGPINAITMNVTLVVGNNVNASTATAGASA